MSNPSSEPMPHEEAQEKDPTSWEELRRQYPQLPEHPPRPKRSVECNTMSYTDDMGVERQIWMPKGTMETACKHLEKRDWKALARWPIYVDQGYADEGEAEEKERKEWEWLTFVDDEEAEPAEAENTEGQKKQDLE